MIMKAHVHGGLAYHPNHEQFPGKSHIKAKRKSRLDNIRARTTNVDVFYTFLNAVIPDPYQLLNITFVWG